MRHGLKLQGSKANVKMLRDRLQHAKRLRDRRQPVKTPRELRPPGLKVFARKVSAKKVNDKPQPHGKRRRGKILPDKKQREPRRRGWRPNVLMRTSAKKGFGR
jgi:hypothetical protein